MITLPRYYVPLTTWGRLVLQMKLHNGVKQAIPEHITLKLINLRTKWYHYKCRNFNVAQPQGWSVEPGGSCGDGKQTGPSEGWMPELVRIIDRYLIEICKSDLADLRRVMRNDAPCVSGTFLDETTGLDAGWPAHRDSFSDWL
jgi:hypothetical protein